MTKTNADRMFESYMDGSYYYKKSDSIRLTDDNIITDYHTPIGRLDDVELADGTYNQFVVLSLQEFKSQRNLKAHINQIVKAAARAGYLVLFVDHVDIGFGEPLVYEDTIIHVDRLLRVYKMSDCEPTDRKNAACVIDKWYDEYNDGLYTKTLYTMTQKIDDTVYQPEEIFEQYLTADNKRIRPQEILSLFAPTAANLRTYLDFGTINFRFFKTCLTPYTEYDFDCFDKVQSRKVLTYFDTPFVYKKITDAKVEKFFAKEK